MVKVACSNCHRFDQGALKYTYLGTFEDHVRVSWRLRLCPVCDNAFIPDLLVCADRQREDGAWLAPEQR